MSSSWLLLVMAGLLEVCWAVGLKYSEGFTHPISGVFTGITMVASMVLLSKAVQTLPIGTAYAVWVGIGAVGAGILGIILFKEPATPLRIGLMTLLVISIVGLKLTAPTELP